MRLARSRFNNRAALLGTPIGTKVALRSAATMPTMSERACMQHIADSLEHAPEGVRWEVATDMAFCVIGRSCEESVQSLAAWYGSLRRRFPSAVIEFVSSVSALDLDQSFHVLKVLEVLTDSNAEQVRSAVALGAQQRRRERQAACCPRALGAVHAQQPEHTGSYNPVRGHRGTYPVAERAGP